MQAFSKPQLVAPDVFFAVSPGQRRLWIAEQIEPGSAYTMPLALDLHGSLDTAALHRALCDVVARHEALRTSVAVIDGEPQQAIHPRFVPELPSETIVPEDLENRLAELVARPFDLSAGPPLRAALFRTTGDRWTFLLCIHHLIGDGWSVGIMLEEMRAAYDAALGKSGHMPDVPSFHFADYSEWARGVVPPEADLAYWDARLTTLPAPLDIGAREAMGEASCGTVRAILPERLTERVATFARACGSSPFFVLLAAYAAIVARLGAVDDLIVAIPVANRNEPEFERTVGFFVNTLPMRIAVAGNATLGDLVRDVTRTGTDDLDHQGVSYDEILARARRRHGEGLPELARVLFAYQNTPLHVATWKGLAVTPRLVTTRGAKFDLAVSVDPRMAGTEIALDYRTDRLGLAQASAILDAFVATVEAIATLPESPVAHIALPSQMLARAAPAAIFADSGAPSGAVEKTLAELWSTLLVLPPGTALTRQSNFFALGGDSIVALRLVAQAKRAGIAFRARDVFRYPTLGGLAAAATDPGTASAATSAIGAHDAALTPIERWFFHENTLADRNRYAQAIHVRLRDDVSRAAFDDALAAVVAAHPAFGLRYRVDGTTATVYDDPSGRRLSVCDFPADTALETVATALVGACDIESGPLAVVGWIGDREALVAIHHLAVDVASWYVLLGDLADALAARALPPPGPGRAARREALATRAEAADLAYWTALVAELADAPQCAPDRSHPGIYAHAARRDRTIDGPVYALFAQAVSRGAVAEELVLAACLAALAEATGHARTAVTLERHGRDIGELDLSRSVGWHTVLAPFVVDITADAPPERLAGAVAEALARWNPRAADFFALREGPLRDATLPSVAFNFLGRMTTVADGPIAVLPNPDVPLHDPAGTRPFAYEILAWTDATSLTISWTADAAASAVTARHLERVAFHLERLCRVAATGHVELPATPLQAGLLFHTLDGGRPGTYLQQVTAEIEGEVDPECLHAAWQDTLVRHDALSTGFTTRADGTLVQRFDPDAAVPFRVLDLSGLDAQRQEGMLAEMLAADRREAFAFGSAPMMRIALARRADRRFWFLWTHHHAILDGWSLPVVLGTLLDAYRARRGGSSLPRAGTGLSYAEYTRWRLGQDDRALAAAWRENLAAFEEPWRLRVPPPDAGAAAGSEVLTRVLDADLVTAIRRYARAAGATVNAVMLAAWALALRSLGDAERVVLGVTVSGRHAPLRDIERLVGLLINSVPLALRVDPALSATAWVLGVQQALAGVADVAHASLAAIQRWANNPGTALFETLYVYENYPRLATSDDPFAIRDVAIREDAHYPLVLAVIPDEHLSLRLAYDRARIDATTARGIVSAIEATLTQIVAVPSAPIGALALRGAIADGFARERGAEAAAPMTGAALIARAARLAPNAIAVEDGPRRVTYDELVRRADAIARRLRAAGVPSGTEAIVGICMQKSVEAVATVLAVWKCGAAFLPLDPEHPIARRAAALAAANARLVVTDATTDTEAFGVPRLVLGEEAAPMPESRLDADTPVDALAYAIYTSGSTGTPKGVAVTHRGLANLYAAQRDIVGVASTDRILAFASPAFDASIAELLMALARGATLVLPPPGRAAIDYDVASTLRDARVTNVTLPPALLAALDPADVPELRSLLIAGDAANAALFRRWSPGRRVFNAYGPTEATVCAALWEWTDAATEPDLGGPMAGVELFVLDGALQPVPPGIPGEIVLGGVGLARGYLQAPAATAAAFVPHPFARTPGERLYRTGDRGVVTANGAVRFLGRIDRQTKIRGYRAEPAETEAALARLAGVAHAVAIVAGEAEQARLVAFVQALPESEIVAETLRDALARTLPTYLIPTSITLVDAWPRTPNGKIDRARLLAELDAMRASVSVPAPGDELVRTIAELWADVLRIEAVAATDNFFDLGGDSISALRIAARARDLGLVVAPRDVLEAQTPDTLAMRIRERAPIVEVSPLPEAADGVVPLIPAQRWFFDHITTAPERFLLSVEVVTDEALDPTALATALDAVVAAHDALRLCYTPEGMRAAPPEAAAALIVIDTPRTDAERVERLLAAKGTIDPARGRVLVACLVRGSGSRLLVAAHHLATDAIGMRRILDDLWSAYALARVGRPIAIPRSPGIADYARRLAAAQASGYFAAESAYWRAAIAASQALGPALPSPTRNADTVQVAARAHLDGTPGGAAIEAALLAALHDVLAETPGATLLVEREGHGRSGLPDVDASRLVGWFTAIHPFRVDSNDPVRLGMALAAIPHGGVAFALQTQERDVACWIAFNYLGDVDPPNVTGLRFASDPCGGDNDERQLRARPLTIEARRSGGALIVEWIFDARLAEAYAGRAERHLARACELLCDSGAQPTTELAAFALDDAETAALLQDLAFDEEDARG